MEMKFGLGIWKLRSLNWENGTEDVWTGNVEMKMFGWEYGNEYIWTGNMEMKRSRLGIWE